MFIVLKRFVESIVGEVLNRSVWIRYYICGTMLHYFFLFEDARRIGVKNWWRKQITALYRHNIIENLYGAWLLGFASMSLLRKYTSKMWNYEAAVFCFPHFKICYAYFICMLNVVWYDFILFKMKIGNFHTAHTRKHVDTYHSFHFYINVAL